MRIRRGLSWVAPQRLQVRNGGAWVDGFPWIRKDGAWRQLVPPNAVILYRDSTYWGSSVLPCNGENGTFNLMGRYVHGANSEAVLALGGLSSHGGHGSSGPVSTDASTNTRYDWQFGGPSKTTTTDTSHTHNIPAHEHPNEVDNESLLDIRTQLIPTVSGEKIYRNAVILANVAQATSLLDYAAASAYLGFLKLASSSATTIFGTVGLHNHGGAGASEGASGVTEPHTVKTNGVFLRSFPHSHTEHLDPSVTVLPAYCTVVPNLALQEMYFDQLPSGSIMLFTSSVLPPGWTKLTSVNDRLLRLASVYGVPGGTRTHTHVGPATTGAGSFTDLTKIFSGSSTEYIVNLNHTHTFADSHGTERLHMPSYINFNVAIKS